MEATKHEETAEHTRRTAEVLVRQRLLAISNAQRDIIDATADIAKVEAALLDTKRDKARDKERSDEVRMGKDFIEMRRMQLANERQTLQEWASGQALLANDQAFAAEFPALAPQLAIAATAALL